MNSHDFVRAITTVVYSAAVKGTLDVIESPPGRRPDPRLVELSQWFHSLSSEGRMAIVEIVELAANQATYNFLLVLDGLLTLEPIGAKGNLELFHVQGGARNQVNSMDGEQLSTLFKL
ncbi:MAG: hypothetical protein KF817_05010 [Phycisphaeraceae bacterium]|nr:hypothetical protein [Phycisphaeraceae bacterium]